jgi:hypothetical protein
MQPFSMRRVIRCPDERWQQVCEIDSSSTFYQTPQWYALIAPFLKGVPYPLWFRFDVVDADLVDAVVPLCKIRHFAFDYYVSPLGTYSGVLSEQRLSPQQLQAIVAYLRRLNISLVPSPFAANQLPLRGTANSFIQRIDLASLDAADVTTTWEQGERRRIRVALKKGVVIKEATALEEMQAYYLVYEKSLERWGSRATTRYPFSLFKRIWHALAGTASMRLWLALAEGRVAGGYLSFYHQRHTVPWHGATDQDYFTFGVSQLCIKRMVEFAKESGYRYFDLTRSGGQKGVEDYKRRLGTEKVCFETLDHESFIYATLKRTYKRGVSRSKR